MFHMQPASLTDNFAAILAPGSFFSPVSIELAVALVAAGAQGQTLVELQQGLQWPTSANWQQELAQRFAPLYTALASDQPLIAVACRVYSKAILRPQYVSDVQSVFRAGIEQLTSAAQINAFVSQSTRGMIQEIVNEITIQHANVIAVNALYFKGKWAVAFRQDDTQVSVFNVAGGGSSQCHMMRTPADKQWHYHEDATAQYVKLPYRDAAGAISPFAALVVLPRASKTNALEGTDWKGALEYMSAVPKQEGTLWLPRFELETSIELSNAMKVLGVRRAFGDLAEFAGVSDQPLKIDSVFHKVKVEVDEEGTVAAAVTAVSMACFGGHSALFPVQRFQMKCDRPFAFCIVASPSFPGAHSKPLVLFAGTVTNPGAIGPKPQGLALRVTPPVFTSSMPVSTAASPFVGSSTGSMGTFSGMFGPVAAPIVSQLTLDQRREQACLFTPACRRDVYRVLCATPRGPLHTQPPSHSQPFGTIFGSATPHPTPAPALQWLFTLANGRGAFSRVPPDTPAASMAQTLQAMEHVGQPTELGVAFTEAFELLLATEYVPWWSDDDARRLSIPFSVAFGFELTTRLDISHALRSRALDKDDVEWLKRLPPAVPFDRRLLEVFQ